MAVVVNNELVLHATKLLWGLEATYPWTVRLYVNVRAPTPSDTLGQYTPCTIPGYVDVQLDPAAWVGGITSPGVGVWTYPQITWNFAAYTTAQQSIFGYVVFGNGKVLYAELFPAPFPVPPAGGALPLILMWTSEQCAA